jgi:hypothetical protein
MNDLLGGRCIHPISQQNCFGWLDLKRCRELANSSVRANLLRDSTHLKRGMTSFAKSCIDRRAFCAGIPGSCIHITR